MAQTDLFSKFLPSVKLSTRKDADGKEIEVETREDEEQSLKLQEIVDILVAAGYFRARIKGLPPFDKVVGGMTWCMESCNIDVDVDLLYHENLTIGQKISLTERIVAVLPNMKCPHRIEPHQIQGLDFIHIFPVIQWLVKRSIEYRQEMSEITRQFTLFQYNKELLKSTEDSRLTAKSRSSLDRIEAIRNVYRPKRFYRRKGDGPKDDATRVEITLLEYSHFGPSAAMPNEAEKETERAEELSVDRLMKSLAITEDDYFDMGVLSEEERKKLASHYASLQEELMDGGVKSREEKMLALVKLQNQSVEEEMKKLDVQKEKLQAQLADSRSQLEALQKQKQEATASLADSPVLQCAKENLAKVEDLIRMSESLKEQERQFKDFCKKEMVRLQEVIKEAQSQKGIERDTTAIEQKLSKEKAKVRELRLQLADKNRAVSGLQRRLDEIPSRLELAQYQRRFLELYNQAKHKETKQYYTLYNTLADNRMYMKKELALLNSILDNYPEAMQSSGGKEEFLREFSNVVETVKQTKAKIIKECNDERNKKDLISEALHSLVEQQRRYVMAVRQLSIECRKNEALIAQRNIS